MNTWLHKVKACVADQLKINAKAFVGQILLIAGCVLTSAESPELTAILVGGSLAYNIVCDFIGSPKKEQYHNRLLKQLIILQGLVHTDSATDNKTTSIPHKPFSTRIYEYLKPLIVFQRENLFRVGGLILGIIATIGAIYLTMYEPQNGTMESYIHGTLIGLGASLARIGRGIYDAPLTRKIENLENQLQASIKSAGKRNRNWRFERGMELIAAKNPKILEDINDVQKLVDSFENEEIELPSNAT